MKEKNDYFDNNKSESKLEISLLRFKNRLLFHYLTFM